MHRVRLRPFGRSAAFRCPGRRRFLFIPTRLDKLAVNGVRDALQTLASLKRISRCQVAGILPTFYVESDR